MSRFDKIMNLVWKVPVGTLLAGATYVFIKELSVYLARGFGTYLNDINMVTLTTLAPLGVAGLWVLWIFSDFIFPTKPGRSDEDGFPEA